MNETLISELIKLRKVMADEMNVLPYVLFSEATLRDMCLYIQTTKDEMFEIKGVGKKKYSQDGETFLHAINKWKENNPHVKKKVQIGTSIKRPIAKQVVDDPETPSH